MTMGIPVDASAATEAGKAYELNNVERTYSRGGTLVRAVRGVSLSITAGEMVAFQGPSGSGKSTLLQLLGCLEVPTSGQLRFFGEEVANLSDTELTKIRSQDIGFVFQQFNLIPTLSATENVAIAMVPNRATAKERTARARELLERVGLGHRFDHLPSRMSGGEQQRVAIARALANAPKVVIADEPTGNLDSETAQEVMALISELHREQKVTVIVATHDEEIASQVERRVRLRDGAVTDDAASARV